VKPDAALRIALAGNPNSGKSTIFNALTGEHQHIGNYPGVTVERKEGWFSDAGVRVVVVDLPGTYTLAAHSEDEKVARDYLVHEHPDVVVDVVDASNLERSLYLATELIELGLPLVLVFNKSDLAEAAGYEIDIAKLSGLLGVPIVPAVATKGRGIEELRRVALETARTHRLPQRRVKYGEPLDADLDLLEKKLQGGGQGGISERWLAVKLLEGDEDTRAFLEKQRAAEILRETDHIAARLRRNYRDGPEVLIAERRYGFISGACQDAVRVSVERRHNFSDQVDAVMTHPVLGIPIFLGMMFLLFKMTFLIGDWPVTRLESLFGMLAGFIGRHWPLGEGMLKSLVLDGVIGGVGNVVVFLPNIMLLFLGISILEDSGYMARGAFVMDRLMHRMGLHGRSFIPLLIGFGCSVPAIMATRSIEGRRERLTTMFVVPLVSCSARLAVYTLIIPAFFSGRWQAPVLWVLYLIGIGFAVVLARLLRRTILRGESTEFVMELPPYRLPTLRGALFHAWRRGWYFLKKAGTLILGVSVVMWVLSAYPRPAGPQEDNPQSQGARVEQSYIGRIGHALEPVLRPMGFDWRIGTALTGAFVAKEVFIAQLGVVFAVGEYGSSAVALRRQLRDNYSPLVAVCILLFILISMPCMATVAVMRAESGSWGWALFQLGGLTLLAYGVTTVVYQVGSFLGLGT